MGASIEVKIYENQKKVVKALAKKILKITRETTQPRFDIALSGGKTPEPLFELLASKFQDELPWHKIHLWWGDERCVAPSDTDSNYNLAFEKLISHVSMPVENIHRIKGEKNPDEEADRYSKEIDSELNMRGDWPVFDLILLGLGDDGHTASIFPGQKELFDYHRNCAVTKHPLTGQKRITITGKVLNNSNRIFFMVTGKNKALRISEIMNDDPAARLLPAYYIEPQNGDLVWYIDEQAAALIN